RKRSRKRHVRQANTRYATSPQPIPRVMIRSNLLFAVTIHRQRTANRDSECRWKSSALELEFPYQIECQATGRQASTTFPWARSIASTFAAAPPACVEAREHKCPR